MRLKQFIGIAILLGGMMCAALPSSAQESGEWVQNHKEFPQGSVITKVRLKNNGGSGGFWRDVLLESFNGKTCKINAKKLSVDKVKFKEMTPDTDGWRVYTLPVPAVYNWNKNGYYDELCYTNIQFFVDKELTAAEQAWVSGDSKELKKGAIITKVRVSSNRTSDDQNRGFLAELFDGEETYATVECESHYDGMSSFYGFYKFKSNGLTTEEKIGKWVVYTFKKPVKLSQIYNSTQDVQFIIDNDAKFVFNPFEVITDTEPAITGPDGTTMHHTTYSHRGQPYNRDYSRLDVSGYLSGDRLYEKKEDGSLRVIRQIVNCLPLPVIEGDSVTGVRVEMNENKFLRFYLTYASGDNLAFNSDKLNYSGRLHRNGAVWTMEDSRLQKIEYDNGDVYTGNFYGNAPWYEGLKDISNHDAWHVKYLDGTLRKRNGESIEYIDGKSKQQIAAEKAAEDAKNEKIYQDLCRQFGKKYVDAALNADVIPGMPEELMLRIQWFTFEICYNSNKTKVYRIRGIGMRGNTLTDTVVKGYAWVTNGKVTQITSYPPR